MNMELEIYEALTEANVTPEKAKAVAAAIDAAIDRRYELHAKQLATRGDVEAVKSEIAKAQAEIIKWCMGAIFGSAGMTIAIVKLLS
ncbi:hypothetical protein EII20_10255 [Comamonadaceae bacterium OH2545_COT-014]|nr:hypothetical protein EII20_10255 [Comamonadaceae bacterium OH2545_COT-014]